jgi:phosphatidate cytidylyltransferase
MERISPKKSWEGFIGGFILNLAAAWFLSGWMGAVDRKGWIIISVIISVAGTYGDLIESMLKRSTGVKDSGNIMPGHGGFLDRFDSTVISFPLVFLYITLFG